MEALPASSPAASAAQMQVDVEFSSDDALLPSPKILIGTTDEGGRAPRNRESRRVQFLDDGKLFEGHFTVQSRNLKSIIQYLVDRQSEQDVVIQDLQKQVLLLRTRHLKAKQRAVGDGEMWQRAAAASGKSASGGGVENRVKHIEQFLQLWGVRLGDVAKLVEEYGDPVITPDAYTSYLVDLPAFRFTRREARAFVINASEQSTISAAAAAASDTAARRRHNSSPSKRETGSAGSSSDTERRCDDGATETALEKATAALKKAEMLLEELRSIPARPPPLSSKTHRAAASAPNPDKGDSGGSGSAIDHEARADIEELGDYVMRRFQELETQSMMTAATVARAAAAPRAEKGGGSSGGGGGSGATAAKVATARPKQVPTKKPVANTTLHTPALEPPPLPHTVPAEVIDTVAREDAAASLDLLEELEVTMERRFKEVNSALANIALRTASMAKNISGSAPSVAEPEKLPQRSGSPSSSRGPSSKARSPFSGKRAEKNAEAKPVVEDIETEVEETCVSASASHAPSSTAKVLRSSKGKAKQIVSDPAGPLIPSAGVDQVAREETAALSDRVGDLEDELLERWQAMEERLRIIGRAAMKQSASNVAAGPGGTAVTAVNRTPVVDRKAREDAALSLMRLQQLEKELAQLKRQWASADASARPGLGNADPPADANETILTTPVVSMEPSAPLRDTYDSKVADLEKEVAQRMADVNEAIAQLRGGAMRATPGLNAVASAARVTDGTGRVDALSDINTLAWIASLAPPAESLAILPDQPQTHQSEVTLPSALPAQNYLTLRAMDADALPGVAAEGRLPEVDTSRRVERYQSLLALGYTKNTDVDLFTAYPMVGSSSEAKRTAISRLRPPNAPMFGTHLVERAMVNLPVDTAIAAAGEAANVAGKRTSVESSAAAAAPLVADAQREAVITAKSYLENRTFPASPPPGAPKGGITRVRMSEVRGVPPAAPSLPRQHLRETLVHTEPCLVVNCAWCDTEKAAGPSLT
ncbi:conserved hypothetical protein [Leishmania mexicana MHOM/GT/2001/U1103]|uniref:Uncharacterized protein n=1 Tax=Leishmania mexicana (strain MHOM/GT/2001/U1103) TaxID=929439 RepID=E9ALX3_LEIMU|nr:conserved hypothetical protein [Leishmania mexicana MHOM/GT/2001/U1103]CBZ23928.1 conserved hypothetical protein [Leishmania mexicana MHOM/GT/2001/U1103]